MSAVVRWRPDLKRATKAECVWWIDHLEDVLELADIETDRREQAMGAARGTGRPGDMTVAEFDLIDIRDTAKEWRGLWFDAMRRLLELDKAES
ncbi:MAG: hypothetical protein LBK54_01645 [Propionibacteriaceae bacterium]|jgi:hypothetical protein|nr:hypothetical protein [Propionibacteriaceae bacterium]